MKSQLEKSGRAIEQGEKSKGKRRIGRRLEGRGSRKDRRNQKRLAGHFGATLTRWGLRLAVNHQHHYGVYTTTKYRIQIYYRLTVLVLRSVRFEESRQLIHLIGFLSIHALPETPTCAKTSPYTPDRSGCKNSSWYPMTSFSYRCVYMCIFHVVIMHDKGNNTKEKGEHRFSRSDKT